MYSKKQHFARPWLLAGLLLSIPAFYLVLAAPKTPYRDVGRILYALVVVLLAWDFAQEIKRSRRFLTVWRSLPTHLLSQVPSHFLEIFIVLGALLSVWQANSIWSETEWLLRLGFCGIIFIRLTMLLSIFVVPNRLSQILSLAVLMLGAAGGGFYWLEPKVGSYADGIWLAFTTVSTVGYGDIVPSTPAARVFAVFIVLLGYALFSIVTASIAALFIGEDEKRLERELHADIRALRKEVIALREDLQSVLKKSE
jgi:voltage-gated potassium channel